MPRNNLKKRQIVPSDLAQLMVDIWRIGKRAVRNEQTPETVRVACDIAVERAQELGFEMHELHGDYDENMRVQVVHRDEACNNVKISECLSPAVYYEGNLIKPAEVILGGEPEDAKPNS